MVPPVSGDVAPRKPETTSPKQLRRVLFASSTGTALEWYDFGLYGALAATVLPELFFPDLSPTAGLLASFATFGVGFGARPLGGMVFSHFGDRVGRKKMLMITIILMGVSTVLTGLLPTYEMVGVWAPILLVVLRFIQGLALGGESSAAQIAAMESGPREHVGFLGALVNIGSPIGQILIASTMVLLTSLTTGQQFASWGWRIPFVGGFALALIGLFIRRKMDETALFKDVVNATAREKVPAIYVLKNYWRTVLRLALILFAPAFSNYVVTVFSISYLRNHHGFSTDQTFLLLLLANILGVFCVLLGGRLSDRFGRRPVQLFAATVSLFGAIVYFPLLDTENPWLVFLGMVLLLDTQYLSFGVLAAFLAEPFPTPVRYTGHAMTYTLLSICASAPAPYFATWLLDRTGTIYSVTIVLVILYLIAIPLILISPETRWIPMNRINDDDVESTTADAELKGVHPAGDRH